MNFLFLHRSFGPSNRYSLAINSEPVAKEQNKDNKAKNQGTIEEKTRETSKVILDPLPSNPAESSSHATLQVFLPLLFLGHFLSHQTSSPCHVAESETRSCHKDQEIQHASFNGFLKRILRHSVTMLQVWDFEAKYLA